MRHGQLFAAVVEDDAPGRDPAMDPALAWRLNFALPAALVFFALVSLVVTVVVVVRIKRERERRW